MALGKDPQLLQQQTSHSMHYVEICAPIYLVSGANLREHWGKRASRAQDHRAMASYLVGKPLQLAKLVASRFSPTLIVPGVQVIMARVAPRPLDDDNLAFAFKSIRDGIADALGVNDRDPRVVWTYTQRKGPAYGVVIQVGMLERLPAPPP